MIVETILTTFLSLCLSAGFFWLCKDPVVTGLEWITGFFGRSFSGRSLFVQHAVYGLVIATAAFLFFIFLRKLSKADRKVFRAAVIFGVVIILTLFAIICFEQTIRRDDYWEIHDSQKYGFPGFLKMEFTAVNGRYFNLLLKSMYAIFQPEHYIHIALTVNLLCLCCACVYLCDVLLRISCLEHNFIHSLCGGAGLMMSALFMSPKIWEVWFWAGGTFIYGVGITFAILILALYLDESCGKHHIALTLLCITCACGCSELITASVCAFGAGFIFINLIIGNGSRNKLLIIYTLWSFACTAFILFFSPNAGYAAELSSSGAKSTDGMLLIYLQRLPECLKTSVETLWWFLYGRLEYAVFLAVVFFMFGICFRKRKFSGLAFILGILWLFLTAAGVLTLNIFMNYVPGRVLTIPLLWVFLMIASCFFLLGTHVKKVSVCKAIPSVCIILLCILGGWFYKGSISLLRDIHLGWTYRDQMIRSIEDKTRPVIACTIPVIGSTERDLSSDPSFEVNLVTAVYYQVPEITGGNPCPPFDKD